MLLGGMQGARALLKPALLMCIVVLARQAESAMSRRAGRSLMQSTMDLAGHVFADRFLVKSNLSEGELESAFRSIGKGMRGKPMRVGSKGWLAMSMTTHETADSIKDSMMKMGLDVLVEPDLELELMATPNDNLFSQQWYHDVIGSKDAWDLHTGSILSPVTICVVDTGFDYTHSDLRPNVDPRFPNGYSGETRTLDSMEQYNASTGIWTDHGTHVAGVAAAAGNNWRGGAGVAWNIKIAGCRAADDIGLHVSFVVECLRWCRQDVGATISINSYGDRYFIQTLFDEVQAAQEAGQLFVAAAANKARDLDAGTLMVYPAGFPLDNIIAVCATDETDQLAAYSNWGAKTVDLCAPGDNILAPDAKGGYSMKSGTSMATPLVAGAAGLIASYAGLTDDYAKLKLAILEGVDVLPDLVGKTVTGGRLNVNKAIQSLYATPKLSQMVLLNQGFEFTLGGDRFTGVANFNGSVQLYPVTSPGAYHLGSKSFGVSVEGITTTTPRMSISYRSRDMYFDRDHAYIICIWAKYTNYRELREGFWTRLQLHRASDNVRVAVADTAITNAWSETCIAYTNFRAEEYYIRLGVAIFNGADVVVDDVTVTRQRVWAK